MLSLLYDLLWGGAFVVGAIALSFASYWIARRLTKPSQHERHREMAGAMVTRIAALHGLILALVFAQEMASYQRLDTQTALEASAVADVFNDAWRYDPTDLSSVQASMRDYLSIVVNEEWSTLGNGQGLSPAAWAAWNGAYNSVLDLVPVSPRQDSLREHMLSSLHSIAASRDQRSAVSDRTIADFFWIAAIAGAVLIAAGHYIYSPDRHNLTLLALFSGYTGAILFLIWGFSNPYSPPVPLSPAPLANLALEIEQSPSPSAVKP